MARQLKAALDDVRRQIVGLVAGNIEGAAAAGIFASVESLLGSPAPAAGCRPPLSTALRPRAPRSVCARPLTARYGGAQVSAAADGEAPGRAHARARAAVARRRPRRAPNSTNPAPTPPPLGGSMALRGIQRDRTSPRCPLTAYVQASLHQAQPSHVLSAEACLRCRR